MCARLFRSFVVVAQSREHNTDLCHAGMSAVGMLPTIVSSNPLYIVCHAGALPPRPSSCDNLFATLTPAASSPAAWEPVWARFTATNGPLASDNLNKPLRFRIPLQHNAWELLIEPESGSWTPVWRDGLIALVVVGSVLVSLGLFAILWSRAHNQMILKVRSTT